MPHRRLRVVWHVAVVLTVVPSLSAQEAPRVAWSLGFGPNLSVGSGYAGGGTVGLHVLAGGSAQLSRRTALRLEAMALMQGGSAAEPSCVGPGSCEERTLIPSQFYGATLSVAWRPIPSSARLELIGGAGGYLGDGIGDSPWSSSFGVVAGLAASLRERGHGPRIALCYHHLTRTVGDMRGVVVPSVLWTF